MDHSEQIPSQLEQIPAAPGFGYTAIPVLATTNLRAPVPLPTLLPQPSDYRRAEHFNNLQHKLQLFWEYQRQQVEQTTDFKKHCVPIARIKKIMRADPDVNMIATETPVLFAKAIEMFIIDMTLRGWTHTEEDGRRILKPSDIAAAITENHDFDFLADVVPKHLANPTTATIPEAPDQQQYAGGPSGMIIDAGGQQAEANMALPQLPPCIDCHQLFTQESLVQAFTPWAPQPQQNDQQSSVPLAPQTEQMQLDDMPQQNDQQSSVPLAPQSEQMQLDNNEEV